MRAAAAYRKAMGEFAAMGNLDVWYAQARRRAGSATPPASVWTQPNAEAGRADVVKARSKDSMQAFDKLTDVVDGEPRIISDPPLIVPVEECSTEQGRRDRGSLHDVLRGVPPDAAAATVGTCSRTSGSSTWPARWSGSAASAPGPGSC